MHMYGLLRTEVDTGCLPPALSTLLIEEGRPTESRTHHLTSQLVLGIPCLCLLSFGVRGSHHICLVFMWVVEIGTLVLTLDAKFLSPSQLLAPLKQFD